MPYYKKNKNFIPLKIVKQQEELGNKGEIRGIFMLLALVVILAPFSIDRVLEKEKKEIPKIKEEVIDKGRDIIKDIEINVEGIGFLESKGGIVKISEVEKERLEEIEKKEGFDITTIEKSGNNNYNIEVRRR